MTRFSVHVDSYLSASRRSGYARSPLNGHARFSTSGCSDDTRLAVPVDSDSGPRSGSATRSPQDAGRAVVGLTGFVTSRGSVDAGLAVVCDADFPAARSAENAKLASIVYSGAITAGRSDYADATVVGDADFPADAVFVDGVDAALPLRAAVGRVVAG